MNWVKNETWFDRHGGEIDISRDPVIKFSDDRDSVMVTHTYPCPRCGGSGSFARFGVCYNCNGDGNATPGRFWFFTEAGLKRVNLAKNKKDARNMAKAKEIKAAAREEWSRKDPELLAALDREVKIYSEAEKEHELNDGPYPEFPEFVFSILRKIEVGDELTEKMDAGIRKYLAGREKFRKVVEERKAEESPIPKDLAGARATVEGEILSTKFVENAYGSTKKMLLKDDRGFKLWGSVPGRLGADKGDRVKFDAMIEISNDDPTFGFFKRPTKATMIEEAT